MVTKIVVCHIAMQVTRVDNYKMIADSDHVLATKGSAINLEVASSAGLYRLSFSSYTT